MRGKVVRAGPLIRVEAQAGTGLIADLNCTYFADLETQAMASVQGQCLDATQTTLSDTAAGTVLSMPEIWPEPIRLLPFQLVDDVTPVYPEGFDVLGVRPGMTRAEIEAIRAERGWASFDQRYGAQPGRRGGWRVGYGPEGTPADSGGIADAIRIEYQAAANEEAAAQGDLRAVEVVRDGYYAQSGQTVAAAGLDAALREKYGIPGAESRVYLADGVVSQQGTETRCRDLKDRMRNHEERQEVLPFCALQVTLYTQVSNAAGNRLSVTLVDMHLRENERVKLQVADVGRQLERISEIVQPAASDGGSGGSTVPEL